MKDITIVIPVFNEEKNLPILVDRMEAVMVKLGLSYEYVFVDDGSYDGSLKVLKGLKEKHDCLRIIKLRKNCGQTAALAAGFDSVQGRLVVTMDADLQNDPEDIPVMIAKLNEGYDIVSGWRDKRKDPLFSRRLPSLIANRIISRLTGVKLHDFGCTLKVYKSEAIRNVRLYGEMHRFIPAIASDSGIKIAELRVRHHNRKYGKSKYGISRVLRVLLDLLTVKFFLSYSTSPMQIFGFAGIISILGGTVSFAVTVVMKIMRFYYMTGNPLLYISFFFFTLGVQLILMGFLGEILIRIYYETQHKHIYHIEEVI